MVPYQPQLPLLLPTDHICYKASRVIFFKVSYITSLARLQFFSDFHYKILWSLIWNPPKLQLHLPSLTSLPTKLLQLYIGHSPPSPNMPSLLLFHGLCTLQPICLNCSSPPLRFPHGWLLFLTQVLFPISRIFFQYPWRDPLWSQYPKQ